MIDGVLLNFDVVVLPIEPKRRIWCWGWFFHQNDHQNDPIDELLCEYNEGSLLPPMIRNHQMSSSEWGVEIGLWLWLL